MTTEYEDALAVVEDAWNTKSPFNKDMSIVDFNDTILAIKQALQDKINGGWLPIESAPKDGTEVLVTDGKEVVLTYYYEHDWYVPHHSSPTGTMLSEVLLGLPTHYQPLPQPPKE